MTNGAQRIRRTTEAADILGTFFRPAKCVWQIRTDAQRVGIEIFLSIQTDTTQHTVIEGSFHNIRIFGIARHFQHTPVEKHIADIGAGLVMRRTIRQLIRTAIALVYFLNTVRLIAGTIRRSTVIQRTARSCNIHLAGHNVFPDAGQVFHQLVFSCFGIHIGHTGIQVIGTHGMSHRIVLLTERNTVLIIIGAIFHHTTDINQILGKFQITGIPCSTVHFHHAHIMGGTNSISCQFRRSGFIEMTEEVRRFYGSIE